MHEGEDDSELLLVALGQRLRRAVHLGAEALDQLVLVARVAKASHGAEVVEDLAPCRRG